jgi:hypothetical protein
VRKPQGIARRIPRKPGTKVTYTQEQTDRYKSLDIRLEAAAGLVDLIEEIPSDRPGRVLYFFPSDRAPKPPGGWVVTVDEDEPPLPTPPTPDPLGPPPRPGPPQNTASTVFVARLSDLQPGLPPEITDATGRVVISSAAIRFGVPSTILDIPWLLGARFQAGLTLQDLREAPNLFRIVAAPGLAGQTLNQLGGGYWVQAGMIYTLRLPTGVNRATVVVTYRYVPRPGEAVPLAFSGAGLVEYEMPIDSAEPLIFDSVALQAVAYPVGFDPTNPDPPPPDPADPDPPQDPPLPLDPGRRHYECNCPDYTRIELQDPASEFPSRWRDRVWIESDAGAPTDEDGRAYCKHVLAAMIRRGDTLPSSGGSNNV